MSDFIILNNFFSRFSVYGSRYRSAEDDGAKEADSPPRKDRVPLGANEVGEGEEAKGGGVGALSVDGSEWRPLGRRKGEGWWWLMVVDGGGGDSGWRREGWRGAGSSGGE